MPLHDFPAGMESIDLECRSLASPRSFFFFFVIISFLLGFCYFLRIYNFKVKEKGVPPCNEIIRYFFKISQLKLLILLFIS